MSGTDFALFDDTHFNPPERYEPTATVLKKKFDAFLHVLIPLLRPTDNLDKYSGADDTREMRDLGGMFKLADPVGKATRYLFCVLHKEKLLDPKGIEQYFLAQGTHTKHSSVTIIDRKVASTRSQSSGRRGWWRARLLPGRIGHLYRHR